MTNELVVASNRGPVGWSRSDDGELTPSRGAGGLVTAMSDALQRESGTWVSVALDDDDREVAAEHAGGPFDVEAGDARFRLRLLDAGDDFGPYYNEVSNRLLWFTVHELWGAPYEPAGVGWTDDWDAYRSVNRQVAEAVVEEASGGEPEVLLQDYHLCTAPRLVRDALPDAPLLHYVHTPWTQPAYLQRLPDAVADAVLRGLLAADVLAFSSPFWCRAFRRCAEDILGAATDGDTVEFEDHRTVVTDFVLGADQDSLAEAARSDEVAAAGRRLDEELDGRRLVLRVDRTDLSKNILRGLRSFETLLERHPEHRGAVWHLAQLNPSRQDVPEYRQYLRACVDVAGRIRERFGESAVTLSMENDFPRVVAGFQRSDVLLVNPVVDGTNLVAKEGPVLNDNDGVLVLSRTAGAADLLGEAALCVNPYDVEETAETLHAALTMDADERAGRARLLREAAGRGSPGDWLYAQRELLRATVARRR